MIKTRDGEALVSVSRIAEDDIDSADPGAHLDQQVSGGAQSDDTGIVAGDVVDGSEALDTSDSSEGDGDPAE